VVSYSNCQNIYFATDGPKNLIDEKKISECEKILFQFYPNITSNQILKHEFNLGCRLAMARNISWFFNQVEVGIVLEDDCLPSPSFFDYMIDTLEQFKHNEEIFMVSGYSPITWQNQENLRMSIYPLVWGWGSWSDRIIKYELDFKDHKDLVAKAEVLGLQSVWGFFGRVKWRLLMKMAGIGALDTWDYSLTATAWRNRKYCIHTSINYIENIGFRDDATHTRKKAPKWAKRDFGKGTRSANCNTAMRYGPDQAEFDFELGLQIFGTNFNGWLRLKLSLLKNKKLWMR